MGIQDKVVISCAISGAAANRQQCPYIPYTPEEYGQEARRARDAGASVVHIHARKPDTGAPSYDVEDYRAITDAILAEVPDIIVNYSTGAIGIDREQRVAQIADLRPEIGALNMGSMNYAIYSRSRKAFHIDAVFANPFGDIIFFLETMRDAGTKPEHECFDSGHINNVMLLADMGLGDPRPHFSLIMGVHGGIAATVPNLIHQVSLLPADAHWQVIGVRHPEQWRMIAAALGAGGSVRVGLEDNFYTADGEMATSNGDLVAKAARMAADVGRPVAEPNEAREMLGIAVPDRARTAVEARR
ncbi:MAG TPA: 3-keto-5-aminohexanoate cleavage protein [Actinomycetota bacterium]|nr:3-keto-5-aminohexanoate cleavage protein [Actinomycetota bacterium]